MATVPDPYSEFSSLAPAGTVPELDFLPPAGLNHPWWRSLVGNLRERIFPPRLPALQLTSRPVDLGMPLGDVLSLPWYRTIFTSVGDVITPETLPPLRLESRPVEVGELLSDRVSHPWWTSLLRNLADAMSPETLPPLQLDSRPVDVGELVSDSLSRPWWESLAAGLRDFSAARQLPPLYLTAHPVNPGMASFGLQLPHWSALAYGVNDAMPAGAIATSSKSAEPSSSFAHVMSTNHPAEESPVPVEAVQVTPDSLSLLVIQFKNDLSRARRREVLWISAISLEIIFLFAGYMKWL